MYKGGGGGRRSGGSRTSGGGGPSSSHSGGDKTKRGRQGDDEFTRGPNIFNPDSQNTTPDPQVDDKEDKNISSRLAAFNNPSVQDLALPARQAYGKAKDNFKLRTNYFNVKLMTGQELFKYTVTIEPVSKKKSDAITNGSKRRQLYKLLFQDVSDFQRLGAGIATDYVKTVITSERLYGHNLSQKDYEQVYRNEYEQPRKEAKTKQLNEQRYKVTVKSAGMVPISELIDYINSQQNDPSDFSSGLDAIQALNIIVAGFPNKDEATFQSGQNKFFRYPRNNANKDFGEVYGEYDLGGCLIGVRGYYSSIRTSTSRILLNVNAQCSAFYPEMNLWDLYKKWSGDKEGLERFINKLRVRTKHNQRVKTIKGFAPDSGDSNSIRFNCDDKKPATTLSVAQYFLNKYNIKLSHPKEIIVNCGTDEKPAWMPPELCFILPGQAYRGPLDEDQTTRMLDIAARGPAENARRITRHGLSIIGIEPQSQTLRAFGITVSPEMLPIHARLLSIPRVRYKSKSQTPSFADWNIRDDEFYKAAHLEKWAFISLGNTKISDSSWRQIKQALNGCGIGYINPAPYDGYRAFLQGVDDDQTNENAIATQMARARGEGAQLILVVLNSKSAALRARVKWLGDIVFGVHTVCVLSAKLIKYAQQGNDRNARVYFANVLHKFNLKLGGVNHKLDEKDLDMLACKEKLTMVVGIDVTHPAPKSMENAPSIVGMVASVDQDYCHWPGSIRIQESKQEIQKLREASAKGKEDFPQDKNNTVSNIASLMEDRLSVFRAKNGRYPDNILIYRDGVSEGQYEAVLKYELRSIEERCRSLYPRKGDLPKITIVVVGKRHHTRFYPTDQKFVDTFHKDNNEILYNCKPGTVVDRGITMLKGWDFFLQSHAAIKGTAKPAHYVIIHNGIGLVADQVEKITHNLCYFYNRCTKAVSVCPPVYYADVICERGRCYLMKDLNPRGKPSGYRYRFPARREVAVHDAIKNDMFYI